MSIGRAVGRYIGRPLGRVIVKTDRRFEQVALVDGSGNVLVDDNGNVLTFWRVAQ